MADVSVPAFKKRANKSSNTRKRPATPLPADSDSGSGSDFTDDEGGVRVKRRKKEGLKTSTAGAKKPHTDLSKFSKFDADRNTSIRENDDATKLSTWYTDASLAAASGAKAAKSEPESVEMATDGNYKGTTTYGSFIAKNTNGPGRQVGPVKAPTNVRMITVTDFAPDVCKDYKQTGFCGFGDSCKFLHAREDYKQGWQLDKEWEKAGKRDKAGAKDSKAAAEDADLDDEEKTLKEIPFKCIICKEDYKNPVVTKCGHYFCEKCAMQRYMKEKKKGCANCGTDTGGSFGMARKLRELLEKKKRRAEEREAKENEHDVE